MTRRTTKLLVPAGLMAGALLAVACGPPRVVPPGGGTTHDHDAVATDDDRVHASAPPVRGDAAQRVEPRRHRQLGRHRRATTSSSAASSTRPTKGNQSAPRSNVMAVERTTGNLLPFVANTNGIVRAVISDGFNVYIGGDFTTVNGVPQASAGQGERRHGRARHVVRPQHPDVRHGPPAGRQQAVRRRPVRSGERRAAARRGAAGQGHRSARSRPSPRTRSPGSTRVAINPAGTQAVPRPGRQRRVRTCSTSTRSQAPTRGPNFSLLSDYIRDVTVGPDGTIYVAAGGKMNSAIAINPATGRQRWRQRADGDVQAVKYSNGYLFFGFHDGFGGEQLAADPGRRPGQRRPGPELHARLGLPTRAC